MTTKAELRRQLAVERERADTAWKIISSYWKIISSYQETDPARNARLEAQRTEIDVAWERVKELQTALDETTEEINNRTVPTEIYDMVVGELREAKYRIEALERTLDDLERAASARQAYRHLEPYLEAQEAAERAAEKWRLCEYKWGEGPGTSKLHRCEERKGHQGEHKCAGYMKAISCDATTENLTTIVPPPPSPAFQTTVITQLEIKRDRSGKFSVKTLP